MLSKLSLLFSFLIFCAEVCHGQTSSFGPGKGPSKPGMKSKYTYPQPPKASAWGPEKIQPAYEIPENPEKYIWKLTTKNFGADSKSQDVPVFTFDPYNGRRTIVGSIKVGAEITLDEVYGASGRQYYKVNWNGAPNNPASVAKEPDYWIEGGYIEYAGKK
jgi:hypothetical protein